MASFIFSRSLLVLFALFSRILISEATSLFSFTSSHKNASFASNEITLYGDAKLVDNGSSIQLTDSESHGGGRVFYKKPIESVDTKSERFSGFATVFSFSISPGHGGRLGLVVFPANGTFDHPISDVKLDFSEDFTKFRDSNVTVIVNGSTMVSEKVKNVKIVYSEKEKLLLYAKINYQASGKFVEVWLSKSESFTSVDSLCVSRIDMLNDKDEFMVGIKSYSGNFDLHSWRLDARRVPKNMHSYVLILEEKRKHEEEAEEKKRRDRIWDIMTGLVMTFGSTGLVFLVMMHIWAAFKRNNLVMECGIKTKEFEYEKMEKMEVVMSKAEVKQDRE